MNRKKFFASTKNRILLVVGIAVLLGVLCFFAFNKFGADAATDSKQLDVSAKYYPEGTDFPSNLKTDASSILSADIIGQTHTGEFAVVDDTVGGSYSNVYHLRNRAVCGITGRRDSYIDYEGYAGIKVATNGTKVSCKEYTHFLDKYQNGTLYIRQNSTQKPHVIGDLSNGDIITFDYEDYIKKGILQDKPGLSELLINTEGRLASVFLFYDGKAVRTCRVFRGYGDISDKIAIWNSVVGDIDPQNCLDMWVGNENYPITYPTGGQGGCNHVDLWRQKAHEIIPDKFDYWTDEMRVFALVTWMTDNIAYDDWRVYNNSNKSRATLAGGVWDDDNLWCYYNHVGNCWDCANILTIMCRELGIPCFSVDNDEHTANAVWLNDEWVCIDVSSLLKCHCDKEDTDRELWKSQSEYYVLYQERYGFYAAEFDTHNQGLCTPGTAL